MNRNEIEKTVTAMAQQARAASLQLAQLSSEQKNKALFRIADLLEASTDQIILENKKDLDAGKEAGITDALLDRLLLNPERIADIATGVREVAALPDPVGEEMEQINRPNGLKISKIRVPIGVIGIIFESRPNVTIDCAVLCLKSGNASILRGGREAFFTNSALAAIIATALPEADLPVHTVQLIPTTDRQALNFLLKLDSYIQCIIPRGGEGLIRFVTENSLIPVIKHYTGICHVFVDQAADPDMAESIAVNSKCHRPGVCNAVEKMLIHADVAPALLPRLAEAMVENGVELRLDESAVPFLPTDSSIPWIPAKEEDWTEEYLSLTIAVKVVPSLEAAVDHINTYGSGHSDTIVTANEKAARTFLTAVDSAAVYWNASTRFTDGYEFGMGAEIGISTDKLHARGPMGLKELCSYKYVIIGTGQIR